MMILPQTGYRSRFKTKIKQLMKPPNSRERRNIRNILFFHKAAETASESTKHIQTWQFRLRWIRSLKAWQCTWETKQQLSRTKASTHTQVRKSCTHLAEVKRLELEANTRGPTPYVALISSRSACEYQLMVGKECERVQPCWVSPWSANCRVCGWAAAAACKTKVMFPFSKQPANNKYSNMRIHFSTPHRTQQELKASKWTRQPRGHHENISANSEAASKQQNRHKTAEMLKSSSYLMMISQQLDNNPTQTKTGWLDGSQTAHKGFPQFK